MTAILPLKELDIIQGLSGSQAEHDRALASLYQSAKQRSDIIAFCRSKGVKADDAKTLWTDVCIRFGLLVRRGKYEHTGKLGGYLKNLASYMVLNHFRDERRSLPDDYTSETEPTTQQHTIDSTSLKDQLDLQLQQLGDVCRQVLHLWSMGDSMKDIMQTLGIVSEAATRKRKHDCLKRLYKRIETNKTLHDTFTEYLVSYGK